MGTEGIGGLAGKRPFSFSRVVMILDSQQEQLLVAAPATRVETRVAVVQLFVRLPACVAVRRRCSSTDGDDTEND